MQDKFLIERWNIEPSSIIVYHRVSLIYQVVDVSHHVFRLALVNGVE